MNEWLKLKLEDIAEKHLGCETLKTRNMCYLDFYNISVWQIKNALKEAYQLGLKQNKK